MKQKKRITLLDVAKHAGVSRATASLIVRGSPNVSERTRNKVLNSIQELGYVYDRVAANMRSQRSSTVGVIITDIANSFFADLLIGVHNNLEEYGYIEFLGTTFDSDHKQERLLSKMLEHRVGGIILCPVSDTSAQTIERIKQLDIPLVLAVRELPTVNCDFVGIDYLAGAQLAVNHLIHKGHRRLGFLGGLEKSSAWRLKNQGYGLALQQAGLKMDETLVVQSKISRDGGREAIRKILAHPEPPTAVICWNDIVAQGVMQELDSSGLKVGEDVAVIGFDNIQESSLYNPPLTTLNSFARLIGSQAANLLQQRILNPDREKQRIILQPELIVRNST